MARTVKPLNDTQIKQAKPKEKEYSLSDGSGLQLSIRPNGTKSWLFKYYRPFTKKRTNLSFGQYPQITLAAARAKREEARGLLANEIDPKEYKEQQFLQEKDLRLNTFEKVAHEWFELKKLTVKPKHAEGIWGKLKNHVLPELGKRPISNITAVITIATLKPVAAKGSLIGGERLPEFMEAFSRASIKFPTRCAIEWQLHTMVRPNEATKAKWSEIDYENKLWILTEDKMKMSRVHKVPLTARALRLLELMKPVSGHREYIFPADRDPKSHMNSQTPNAAIKRMGFKGQLVAHGFRSLASTVLNETRLFDFELIEVALSHEDKDRMRAAYNNAEYIENRREVMSWWSDYINKAKVAASV